MSAAPAKTADPSMEEILASIRRIIADDDDKGPEANSSEPAQTREPPPPVAAADGASRQIDSGSEDDSDEILDLAAESDHARRETGLDIELPDLSFHSTPEPAASVSAPDPVPVSEPAAAPPDMADIPPQPARPAPPAMSLPANPPAPTPSIAAPPRPSAPPREAISRGAESSPEAILSQESTASVGQAFNLLSHTIMSQNQNTLEDLVREMLKPMLKTWLDDNLPPLVERLVTAEIQRVARGQR